MGAFAMGFNNEVLATPIIREPMLSGMGQIAGVSTVKEANELATLLHAGELSARLVVVDTGSSEAGVVDCCAGGVSGHRPAVGAGAAEALKGLLKPSAW